MGLLDTIADWLTPKGPIEKTGYQTGTPDPGRPNATPGPKDPSPLDPPDVKRRRIKTGDYRGGRPGASRGGFVRTGGRAGARLGARGLLATLGTVAGIAIAAWTVYEVGVFIGETVGELSSDAPVEAGPAMQHPPAVLPADDEPEPPVVQPPGEAKRPVVVKERVVRRTVRRPAPQQPQQPPQVIHVQPPSGGGYGSGSGGGYGSGSGGGYDSGSGSGYGH